MCKSFIPTYHANNIFEISMDFYKRNNVKVLLLDLDNTLDSYKSKLPSKKTIVYINQLKQNNIRPIITSNNKGKRVSDYSKALGIEHFSSIMKPFKFRLLKILKNNNIDKNTCMLIGDQLVTDIKCGNACKIKTVLTEKLVKEDQPTTHINRLLDNPLRARLKKCGKLNNWKENK